MSHIIGAKEIPPIAKGETTKEPLDIYIGVFFDGTNNNKVQSMIGQYFRRKEIIEKNKKIFQKYIENYEKHKRDLKDQGFIVKCIDTFKKYKDIFFKNKDFDSFLRSGITRDDCKKLGITDSDCDKLFGSSTTITNDFEKKIMKVDNSDKSYRWSSAAIEYSANREGKDWNFLSDKPDLNTTYNHKEILRKKLEYIIGERDENIKDKKLKGSPSQDATYTNPAILDSLYKAGKDKNNIYYTIYVEGSGADNIIIDGGSKKKIFFTNLTGLAAGFGKTGVFAKCRKAVAKIDEIVNKYKNENIKLHFDVFGFSRGATTSRIFTYLVNSNNDASRKQALSKVHEKKYNDYLLYTGNLEPPSFLSDKSINIMKEIRLLGLYDTVSSIGVSDEVQSAYKIIKHIDGTENPQNYGKNITHEMNVSDYGLWATTEAKNVIHFCALDEYRKNFALVDIDSSSNLEIYMPGCHTDIGGGTDLGLDGLRIINKGKFFIYNYPYEALDNKNLLPIEVSSFMDLGWIPQQKHIFSENDKSYKTGRAPKSIIDKGKTIVIDGTKMPFYDYNRELYRYDELDNIGLYKYVTPGYSNVTLALMRDWALQKSSKQNLFDKIPIDFSIPNDLGSFYKGVNDLLNASGRYICAPSKEEYQKLRCKYLHFSMNEAWFNEKFTVFDFNYGGNVLVNGPEVIDFNNKKVITRRIYSGVKDSNKYKYIHDIIIKENKNIKEIKNVKIDIAYADNYFYLYKSKKSDSNDYMSSKEKEEKKEYLKNMERLAKLVPPLTDSKPQISFGMYSKNVLDAPYIDDNNNFHISRTDNYTEYPKDIDQIHPGIFKSSSKKNK